jgi:LPXTG-motif cell wall-anchored protein
MNSTTRTIGAAFGLASIAAFSIALPASAAVTASEWGVFGNSSNGYDAAVTFTNPDFPDAEIMVSSESTYDFYAPADEDEGFTSEVPADQLVLAISDIDSDYTEITMLDAEDNSVSADDIMGTATDKAFNWADPTDTDNIPQVGGEGATIVSMGNAPDDTDGSTGWVRPSVPISKITISTWTTDGNVSSQRYWIGQVVETADEPLANTGASDSLYLVAAAGGAMLAVGGLVGLRRRQA